MPRPILHAGITTGDELMLYGERDFIGVETAGATDPRGINAVSAWTQRVKSSAIVEHDANGIHDTPRIPRGFVEILWNRDTSQYVVHPDYDSYLMGTYYSDDPTIFSCSVVSDGVFDLTLGIAMPSSQFGIIDACRPQVSSSGGKLWVAVWGSPSSTTVIRITRRVEIVNSDGHDGPCAFYLCG